MFLKTVRDIAKPQQFAIIELLKRSTGMTVAELGRLIQMSYMGVKQHCLDLEEKGWLDTWRRPLPNGRPEKLYRLTAKAADLYPDAGNELTLDLLQSAHPADTEYQPLEEPPFGVVALVQLAGQFAYRFGILR